MLVSTQYTDELWILRIEHLIEVILVHNVLRQSINQSYQVLSKYSGAAACMMRAKV